MTRTQFKEELNRVFDDSLHTKQWHNIADWIIIGLIILSTLEIFLSTFDSVSSRCGHLLECVDLFTQIFFTIEVTLRIWNADMLDPKYKGLKGRIRYCFSFYGLIDILATYPFYFSYVVRIPFTMLKTLRVVRLLRVFRYMHSSQLLSKAISSKKSELLVSLNFLAIVTLMLSFVLFFVEHEAQPEVYENGWSSVVWAFAQYIGDPGSFADMPPVTTIGKIMACLVGIMGIAIVAVPAGLVGSAFTDVMDEEKHEKEILDNIECICHAFRWNKDQHFTGLYFVPPFVSLDTIQTKQYISIEEIVEAVRESDEMKLYNMAKSVNTEDHPVDRIVVVNCRRNTPYGCCIDRGSKVTIVSTSGNDEPITSWAAYHIAKLGGFNYVGKEVDPNPDDPTSYYNINASAEDENLGMFISDIERLSNRPGAWVVPMCFCNGPLSRPHQVHLVYNSDKGDESYDKPTCSIADTAVFDQFYSDISRVLDADFGYKVDRNKYYVLTPLNMAYKIKCKNVFALRMECHIAYTTFNKYKLLKTFADTMSQCFEPGVVKQVPAEMQLPPKEHFGMRDYIEG